MPHEGLGGSKVGGGHGRRSQPLQRLCNPFQLSLIHSGDQSLLTMPGSSSSSSSNSSIRGSFSKSGSSAGSDAASASSISASSSSSSNHSPSSRSCSSRFFSTRRTRKIEIS